MSKDPDERDIPYGVRSLLEPYRVVTEAERLKPPRKIEQTFLPKSERPDEAQLAAIGRVASAWSVMEYVIEMTLSRLALIPPFPALALTNDLSIDNRLKAMKSLLALHKERYRYRIVEEELVRALAQMPPLIASLKDERNRVVHWVWYRAGSERMFGIRFRAATESARRRAGDPHLTNEQINNLAGEIQTAADALFQLAQLLPEVDEASHARSLAQAERPPRRDTE